MMINGNFEIPDVLIRIDETDEEGWDFSLEWGHEEPKHFPLLGLAMKYALKRFKEENKSEDIQFVRWKDDKEWDEICDAVEKGDFTKY